MVEQRPFKALVVGSSPTQPNFCSILPRPGLLRHRLRLLQSIKTGSATGPPHPERPRPRQSPRKPRLLRHSIAPLANSSATSRKKRWVGDAPAQRGYEIMVEISLSVAEFYAANATSHGSPTDSTSGRGPRTDDASKDVRNRRIHLVPNNSPDYKTRVL